MHILKVKKPFSWAHNHVNIKEYDKGEIIKTDDEDLVRVAAEEGWASPHKPSAADLKIEAVEAEIAELEVHLAEADEANKPTVQAALDASRKELEKLQA